LVISSADSLPLEGEITLLVLLLVLTSAFLFVLLRSLVVAYRLAKRAKPSEELHELVSDIDTAKRVLILKSDAPILNAVSLWTLRGHVVVVGGLLYRFLDESELRAVLLHELYHVRSFKIRIVLSLAVLSALYILVEALLGVESVEGSLTIGLVYVFFIVFQGRWEEMKADVFASQKTSPRTYIKMLTKFRAFEILTRRKSRFGAYASLIYRVFDVHPSIKSRMKHIASKFGVSDAEILDAAVEALKEFVESLYGMRVRNAI